MCHNISAGRTIEQQFCRQEFQLHPCGGWITGLCDLKHRPDSYYQVRNRKISAAHSIEQQFWVPPSTTQQVFASSIWSVDSRIARPRASGSKLTSLVNNLLKFQTRILQIHHYFFVEKNVRKCMAKDSQIFSTKNNGVFAFEVDI